MKKVCIIGAGPAGLVAIRHVSSSTGLTGTVFEASSDLGGVWVYKSKQDGDTHGTLYKNMRTNLPKEAMSFPDFFYPEAFSTAAVQHNTSSFLHHTEVLQYLHSYADHFDLRKYIKFQRRVIGVRPLFEKLHENEKPSTSSTPKWLVTVQHTNIPGDPLTEDFEFDAVLICNGHFAKPRLMTVPNLEEFQGVVIHSQDYDDAGPFAGKRVIIVGCGPSGIDISLEVAEVAAQVFISNSKGPLKFPLPENTKEVSKIKAATRDGFLCENGEVVAGDVLIMCTGFLYDFPFLSPECNVILEESQRISPLYRDMVHIEFPSLCFIGIQNHIAPFVLFDTQVQYCVRLFEGLFDLPSIEVMLEEMNCQRQWRQRLCPSLSWSHELGDRQWTYHESLAEEANFHVPQFLSLVRRIYEKTSKRRSENAHVYKNDLIYITDWDSHSFCYVESPSSAETHSNESRIHDHVRGKGDETKDQLDLS